VKEHRRAVCRTAYWAQGDPEQAVGRGKCPGLFQDAGGSAQTFSLGLVASRLASLGQLRKDTLVGDGQGLPRHPLENDPIGGNARRGRNGLDAHDHGLLGRPPVEDLDVERGYWTHSGSDDRRQPSPSLSVELDARQAPFPRCSLFGTDEEVVAEGIGEAADCLAETARVRLPRALGLSQESLLLRVCEEGLDIVDL